MIGTGFHFAVDSILITIGIEVHFRKGVYITWTIFDASEKSREQESFYRPTTRPAPAELDERFRRAQG